MTENIDNEDRYWTVEEIRPYIISYIENIFPDSIIEREFDRVDLMIHGPNIPVEIQRTRSDPRTGYPMLSDFEDRIRRQIERNIETYEQCWFFFDDKLLKDLQLCRQTSINMDWFYQLFKSERLKIFVITMRGTIRELENKDLEFIIKLSDEYRLLYRNKSKISYKLYKIKGFTTDEINRYYEEYEGHNHGYISSWLLNMGGRMKEFAMIKFSVTALSDVDNTLKCIIEPKGNVPITHMKTLGIIEGSDWITCSDKYDFLKYFPGYFKNKELWDYLKVHVIDIRTFYRVVRGIYPNYLKDRKNQKEIEDAWVI